MIVIPTIAFVLLMTPDGAWLAPKNAATADVAHNDGESAAVRAKRMRESALVRQNKKAQLVSEPAARGRAAPQEAVIAKASADEPKRASSADRYTCPENMVMIGHKYCIDVYEASLVERLADGTTKDWSPYYPPTPGKDLFAVSRAGVYPQGYISGVLAKAACEAAGKRLCKPDEWKKACMGPQQTMWPYGADHKDNVCNDHGRSSMHFFNPGLTDKPEDKWKWGAGGNMMDPRLNQLPGTLATTGEHPGCTNEYGVYDMVGNIHEWVDDPYGTFQGGYYLDTHLNGDGCYYRTTAHDTKHSDYSTGFRCCADVDEP